MARHGASDGWDSPAVVEITVVPGPRARAGAFPARRLLVLIGALAAIVAGVGLGVEVLHGAGGSRRTAYREPTRCLDSPVSAAWPSEIDRGGACWHYGVNLTTILRLVNGDWRMALAARSPSCPNVPLPASVRAQLVSCRR